MKTTPIIYLFLFLGIMPVCVTGATGEPQRHSIELNAEGPFEFGIPVILKVKYRNLGRDPWEVPTPKESVSVKVQYNLVGSDTQPKGYRLGHIITKTKERPDGRVLTAYIRPPITTLTIASGKSYDFEVPFVRGWSDHLVPGLWTVWIEDSDMGLISNKVEIPLHFTLKSLRTCLQKAEDEQLGIYQRKWHAKWVHEIMPGCNLEWPRTRTPDQERKKMLSSNIKKLQQAREYLADERNGPAINAAIDKINEKTEGQFDKETEVVEEE